MKRNMKITISALAVMLVMALAVTVLSFSLADNEDNGSFEDKPVLIADTADMYTNIDNIIENSYATGTDVNPVYKIVEIGSAKDKPSSLSTYVSSKGFETYVLNGHATIQNVMNQDCIEYTYYWVGDVTDDNEAALADISNADFIYVSHDSTQEYTPSNDLSEELYNILHTYAVGTYNPIVIDKPAATTADDGSGEGSIDDKTYSLSALASNVFDANGKYYYTFEWSTGVSANAFLQHQEGSMYLGINGTKKQDNWTVVAKQGAASPDTAAKELKMAEILVVNGSTNDLTMTNALVADAGTPVSDLVDVAADSAVIGTVYDIKGTNSILYQYGYNGRYNRPDYARITIAKIGDTADIQLDKYDLVIIESDAGSATISSDIYKKFGAAMYGNISMIYPESMASGGSGSGSTGGSSDMPADEKETNYIELYYMVATSDDMAKYQNVLVTTKADFDVVTTSSSVATADVIADLINASAFRGIGGPSATSNMFTVLEIQPCYPIDEELALEVGAKEARSSTYAAIFGSGNYYTKPSDVVDGKTKEEIASDTQYYQWELSKAKIADVTGLSVNQINLVQMSSEELASSKVDILGNYDLIYVGANNSALKDTEEYRSLVNLLGWGGAIGFEGANARVTDENLRKLPIYTTYSHSGDFVRTTVVTYGSLVNGSKSQARATIGGVSKDNSFAVLNGNDITYNNYIALIEYVEAGMPVVFSKDATTAYQVASAEGYLQNSLDPDSNMFKFMDMCNTRSSDTAVKTKNVLWNFDNTKVVTADNDGGTLGDTNTGYVMVFAGAHNNRTSDFIATTEYTTSTEGDNQKLVDLLGASNVRPRLTLTNFPATYNMYDSTTKLTNKTLTYEYRVTTASNYEVKLYIDDNGNSLFEEGEDVATGSKEKLTYTVADSFYGPLYWMIEVKSSGGMTTNQTGIAYIKNMNNQKQTINILQIMPSGSLVETSDPARDPNTLFFCTVCQQAYHRLDYNPYSDGGDRASYSALYSGRYYDSANGMRGAIYMGRHEHRFGIVKYDSTLELPADTLADITKYGTTGMDNWDINLADEVSDLYDFDIDIMNRKEFEATATAVHEAYDFSGMTEDEKDAIISAFVITDSDPDYEKYSALETKDEKLKFITMRRYATLASENYALYQNVVNNETPDKEEALVDALRLIQTNYNNPTAGMSTFGSKWTKEYFDAEINRMIELETYWDFFSICNFEAVSNDVSLAYMDGKSIRPIYDAYVRSKDKELEYLDLYKEYNILANPDNWIYGCYDTVILGPSDDFAGDDITNTYALADLSDYIDNDGTLLLFHDTLTKFSDAGSSTLTSTLRDKFGMDRYHMEVASDYDGSYYVKYTSSDANKYFMSNLSTKTDETKYSTWGDDMKVAFSNFSASQYLTDVAFTDVVATSDNNGNNLAIPYRYADVQWATFVNWNRDAQMTEKSQTKFGTNRASQNNEGIITMFPFTLSDELNIAGTHSQVYALDIESDDMTVWYSLAAGTNTKDGSSIFAASPRDGMDNYFIYSYNSVYYCGAGHSKVTGIGKDNNDERRLYINIICNSVRKSVMQPDIFVYDYETTKNEKFKKDADGNYVTKVDTTDEYPEFSFLVTLDESTDIQQVRIYYDLDYMNNATDLYTADANHPLVATFTSSNVTKGVLKNVFRYDGKLNPLLDEEGNQIPETWIDENGQERQMHATMLKLQPRYFDPYNQSYTYLVIEVTDSEGNVSYKRIKIQLKEKLFNLT